jgi:hypothetical protein
MEIVIRSVHGPSGEQLFLRADTRAFPEAIARKLEAAVATLTSQSVGHPRPFDADASRYELQIRESPGDRPLTLTVVRDAFVGPVQAAQEIIRLITQVCEETTKG